MIAQPHQIAGRNVADPLGHQLAHISGRDAVVAHLDQRRKRAGAIAKLAHRTQIIETGAVIAGRDELFDGGAGIILAI